MKYLLPLILILTLVFPFKTYAQDILNDPSLGTGLVAYYELEEASGTRVSATSTNNLTENSASSPIANAVAKQGNGIDFESGETEYLTIEDASQTGLDLAGDFTVALWINVESFNGANTIIDKFQNPNSRSYVVYYDNTTFNAIYDSDCTGGSSASHSISYSMSTATWYHVAWVWTNSTHVSELYINGSSVGSASTGASGICNSNQRVTIGGNANNTNLIDGIVDEYGVWQRKLSGTEISTLYASGAGIPFEDAGAPAEATVYPVLNMTGDIEFTGDMQLGI